MAFWRSRRRNGRKRCRRCWLTRALRQRMGQAGRQKVEQQYCLQVTGPKLAALLVAAARAQPREQGN